MLHHADPTKAHNRKVKQSDLRRRERERERDTKHHKTRQKQTNCKSTLLNMHAAENACRNMQNILESHTQCLPTHPVSCWCYPVPCKNGGWNWHMLSMPHWPQTMVKQKCARGQWSKQKCSRVAKMCARPLLSYIYLICTTGWPRNVQDM